MIDVVSQKYASEKSVSGLKPLDGLGERSVWSLRFALQIRAIMRFADETETRLRAKKRLISFVMKSLLGVLFFGTPSAGPIS